jgi:hypothetical protein
MLIGNSEGGKSICYRVSVDFKVFSRECLQLNDNKGILK